MSRNSSDNRVPQNPEDYPIIILRLLQPEWLNKYRSGRERKWEHVWNTASLSHGEWGELFLSLSFVASRAEVGAAGFAPSCLLVNLLFFSFSLSILLRAGLVFLRKTYIASYGASLDLYASTRRLRALPRALLAENKRLLLFLGWVICSDK